MAVFTVIGAGAGLGLGIAKGHKGWKLVGDFFLGAGVGLAAGGLTVASITGFYVGGAAMLGKTATTIFGVAVKQAFALGAVVYNIMAAIIGPLLAIEFQMIEIGGDNYTPVNTPPFISRELSVYYVVGR